MSLGSRATESAECSALRINGESKERKKKANKAESQVKSHEKRTEQKKLNLFKLFRKFSAILYYQGCDTHTQTRDIVMQEESMFSVSVVSWIYYIIYFFICAAECKASHEAYNFIFLFCKIAKIGKWCASDEENRKYILHFYVLPFSYCLAINAAIFFPSRVFEIDNLKIHCASCRLHSFFLSSHNACFSWPCFMSFFRFYSNDFSLLEFRKVQCHWNVFFYSRYVRALACIWILLSIRPN